MPQKLGQIQYLKRNINNLPYFEASPFAGNTPYGSQEISQQEYAEGLKQFTPNPIDLEKKRQAFRQTGQPGEADYINALYGSTRSGGAEGAVPGETGFSYLSRTKPHLFDPNYIDPQYSKYQENAPTPSLAYLKPEFRQDYIGASPSGQPLFAPKGSPADTLQQTARLLQQGKGTPQAPALSIAPLQYTGSTTPYTGQPQTQSPTPTQPQPQPQPITVDNGGLDNAPASPAMAIAGGPSPSQTYPELAAIQTELENLKKDRESLEGRLLTSLEPTEQEKQLQSTLDNLLSSTTLGLNKIREQPIPLSLLVGQSEALQRQALGEVDTLERQLSRMQDRRKASSNIVQTELGFLEGKEGKIGTRLKELREEQKPNEIQMDAFIDESGNRINVLYDKNTGKTRKVNLGKTEKAIQHFQERELDTYTNENGERISVMYNEDTGKTREISLGKTSEVSPFEQDLLLKGYTKILSPDKLKGLKEEDIARVGKKIYKRPLSDKLLSPTEAARLGVPYGTTENEAAEMRITPTFGRQITPKEQAPIPSQIETSTTPPATKSEQGKIDAYGLNSIPLPEETKTSLIRSKSQKEIEAFVKAQKKAPMSLNTDIFFEEYQKTKTKPKEVAITETMRKVGYAVDLAKKGNKSKEEIIEYIETKGFDPNHSYFVEKLKDYTPTPPRKKILGIF